LSDKSDDCRFSIERLTKFPRIGYLGGSSSAESARTEAFWQDLRELGYVHGKNIVIRALAAELVGLKVLDRHRGREVKEISLEAFSRQHDDSPFETELAKVAIEGESMVESMMVDQSKAGAVNETKIFVIVSDENRLGRLFNRFADTKNLDAGLVERLHEFNSRLVTRL
jgi:hypothetical protein